MQDFTNPPQIQGYAPQAVQAETSEALFFQRVYMWMCGGLLVTAAVALGIFNSSFRNVVASSGGLLVLTLLAQFGLVLAIGVLARRLPVAAVRGLFLLYAASMGITVSLFLVVYPSNVIFKAFLSASAIYAGTAAYGLLTKRSLQRLGGFLLMNVFGLVALMVINIAFKSPMLDYVFCWIGVIVFSALTAYDHQKLRVIHAGGFASQEEEGKVVILGALELYLDFINLFLFIVRILGARR